VHNVGDSNGSFTRFLLVEGGPRAGWTASQGPGRRTSLDLRLPNTPGALTKVLSIFADARVNVSKIESRPVNMGHLENAFYLDVDVDVEQPSTAAMFEKLRGQCTELRVLGSYDCALPTQEPTMIDSEWATNPSIPRPDILLRGETTQRHNSSIVPPPASKNWPKAARPRGSTRSAVRVGNVVVGGPRFVVAAGPCSVESREQILETARFVAKEGALLLRGGAFKPRTHPYAFQGLGWDGVALLAQARKATGLPVVSEVMSVDQVERMASAVDVLQIGARNMQNFDLLRAVGKTQNAILLKRGMSATLDELLAAAEYILAEGTEKVLLCERGIRTFDTATRNTLDLSAVPVLRERSHLPIIVDPSHGVGVRRWIRPLARAAKAVGADGIIVEVHPDPAVAKSDADQALRFDQFSAIMGDLHALPDWHLDD
jgi:chorismate mutase/prephenate dehydratase